MGRKRGGTGSSSDMVVGDAGDSPAGGLLGTPHLADTLESTQFKQFLDQVPVAIAVSALTPSEHIVYANMEFARLMGQETGQIIRGGWNLLPGLAMDTDPPRALGAAITEETDHLGIFVVPGSDGAKNVEAWSNIIQDDMGHPAFRLVALITASSAGSVLDQLQERVREKDLQLRELQHRVKNNLQMITALIRVEAQGTADRTTSEGFDRLAGRVESLGLLYRAMSDAGTDNEVDLGIYLSEIASAVMRAHAVEGVSLDMRVETWPVSIDVAMPTGLVVNELLTNSLKHAFRGVGGGTIALRCTSDANGCRVVVADDGIGLPEGMIWPKPGKLSSLIVRSLLQNAHATIEVLSAPGEGMRVTIDLHISACDS